MTVEQIKKGIKKDKSTCYLSRYYYVLPNKKQISVIRSEEVITEKECIARLVELVQEKLGIC